MLGQPMVNLFKNLSDIQRGNNMVMLSQEMKKSINDRVIADCGINGKQIVSERMKVRVYGITFNGTFIEKFRGDLYDLQQRKEELQKIIKPVHKIKYFNSYEYCSGWKEDFGC